MKVRNCKNVKFNGSFVINNFDKLSNVYKFNSNTRKMIELAHRDGLKCDTCNSEAHFKLHPEFGLIMSTGDVRMTLDHDLLNSLEGSDDLDNQHLLCYTCNNLRNNRFAQYKEFKDWYTNVIESGGSPFARIKNVKRNFSYLDLSKNGFNIHQNHKIESTLDVSKEMREFLFNHLVKHGKFKNCDGFYNLYTILIHKSESWNDTFNEMMVKVIEKRLGITIEKPNFNYNVYTKKSKISIDAFLANLNRVFFEEYNRQRTKAKKLVNKGALKQKPQTTTKVEKIEQCMVVVENKMTMWKKITAFVSKLLA